MLYVQPGDKKTAINKNGHSKGQKMNIKIKKKKLQNMIKEKISETCEEFNRSGMKQQVYERQKRLNKRPRKRFRGYIFTASI